MLNVNTATKNAYLSDSKHKVIRVVFPVLGLEYTNNDLVSQSLELKESLCEGDIEFIGCIASQFSITIRNLTDDVKGAKVNVYISMANTTEMTLFTGYVYEVELAAEKRHKKIKAYDALYSLSQTDVAHWYHDLSFPITLKDLRDSLFTELNITQETTTLVNDSLSVDKRFDPATLCALDVIKSLCQINGVFGRINRSGHFEYLSPSEGGTQAISYYKAASYQEFTVKPADKVVVVYDDVEGAYGGGTNIYKVQNNMFASGLDTDTLQSLAHSIYNNVYEFSYQPVKCDINGLPFLECLDRLTMDVADIETETTVSKTFIVLSRTMKGIQSLRDNCFAEGDEFQHLFTSDIGAKIDELKRQVEIIRDDMDNLKFAYYLLTNEQDILIGDGETKKLFDVYFSAKSKSVVTFNCEILLTAETTVDDDDYYDAVGRVTYYLDNLEIVGFNPIETWRDGKHILNLYYYINVQDAGLKRFQAEMDMDGGSVLIKAGNLRGAIYGQNLATSDEWNGVITIDETVTGFNLIETEVIDVSDSVTVSFPTLLSITNTDSVTAFDLSETEVENVTDSGIITLDSEKYRRVTEDGSIRITEENDVRYTEGD